MITERNVIRYKLSSIIESGENLDGRAPIKRQHFDIMINIFLVNINIIINTTSNQILQQNSILDKLIISISIKKLFFKLFWNRYILFYLELKQNKQENGTYSRKHFYSTKYQINIYHI